LGNCVVLIPGSYEPHERFEIAQLKSCEFLGEKVFGKILTVKEGKKF